MSDSDSQWMGKAIELARRGQGSVEPNPMVGCVIVKDGKCIGEGFHQRFGEAHAEVNALADAGTAAEGATAYVTLEPCSHQGKTPPCADALIKAKIARVVIGHGDPFPKVAGQGIAKLVEHGIQVEVGCEEDACKAINRPYLKRQAEGIPWVIAKYAITLDGKIATKSGQSKWISGEDSRAIAHRLRGRVDAILVGVGTVLEDDPLLTARPKGVRVARRAVFDRQLRTPLTSQLVGSASQAPVDIVCDESANPDCRSALESAGVNVISLGSSNDSNIVEYLKHLTSEYSATNVMIEGGAGLLGSMFDQDLVDELWVFMGAKVFGSTDAKSPVGGLGIEEVKDASQFQFESAQMVGKDVFLRCVKSTESATQKGPPTE